MSALVASLDAKIIQTAVIISRRSQPPAPLSRLALAGDAVAVVSAGQRDKRFLRKANLEPPPVVAVFERSGTARWTQPCEDLAKASDEDEVVSRALLETGDGLITWMHGCGGSERVAFGQRRGHRRRRAAIACSNRPVLTPAGVADVGDAPTTVLARDAARGTVVWQRDLSLERCDLCATAGTLLIWGADEIRGLDPARGTELWAHEHPNIYGPERSYQDASLSPGGQLLLDNDPDLLVAFEPRSGARLRLDPDPGCTFRDSAATTEELALLLCNLAIGASDAASPAIERFLSDERGVYLAREDTLWDAACRTA